jgi:hypothetical protein
MTSSDFLFILILIIDNMNSKADARRNLLFNISLKMSRAFLSIEQIRYLENGEWNWDFQKEYNILTNE